MASRQRSGSRAGSPRCASAPFPSQVDLGQGGVPGVGPCGPPVEDSETSCANNSNNYSITMVYGTYNYSLIVVYGTYNYNYLLIMVYDTDNYSIHGVYKPNCLTFGGTTL